MEISRNHLTIIEKMALPVLEALEYYVYSNEPTGPKRNQVVIRADMISLFKVSKVTDLYTVAMYLRENGLDFNITFDLKNDVPHELYFQGSDDWEEVAVLNGENIEAIDAKIKELINNLNSKALLKNDRLKKDAPIYGKEIEQLDLLKDEIERKAITIYINTNYNDPKEYNRKGGWEMLYELARDKEVNFNKGFFDYFNSNKKNPLYSKEIQTFS